MRNKTQVKRVVYSILCGAFIGIINGFLGGGGGMFCVPILQKLFNLTTKQSHCTALFVMLPLSIVSSAVYLTSNILDVGYLLFCVGGVLVGGILGTFLLKKINSKWLTILFIIIMIAAGIRMVIV